MRTIGAQIRLQTKKVQDIENEPALDIEEERKRCKKKQTACVVKLCKCHLDLKATMKRLQEKVLRLDIWKVIINIWPCRSDWISLATANLKGINQMHEKYYSKCKCSRSSFTLKAMVGSEEELRNWYLWSKRQRHCRNMFNYYLTVTSSLSHR